MSINVTVVGSTGISATIGNNDGVNVAIGGTLAFSPLTVLQVTAGANITVTTSSGVFTVIGRDVPVQSVNGRTGAVTLAASDVSAASASHTHVVANITDFATGVRSNQSVSSVAGRTGTVTLTVADITDLNTANLGRVSSVNGRTGTVTLVASDVSAASASHTHVVANITDFATEAAKYGPVSSVNGRTGTVTLVAADVSAASSTHTHNATDIVNLTSVANVVSVNGITGMPLIVAGSGITVSTSGSSITIGASSSSGLPDQGASATRILTTDGTSASWATRYSVVDDVLAVGAGLSFVKNTNAGSITIEAAGGTSGITVGSATPLDLGVAAAGVSGNAAREDHVHRLPTVGDITAAAAVHGHVSSAISDLTSVANVVSVNGRTGLVSLVAGSNVTITTNTSSQVTIDAGGSGGGAAEGSRAILFLLR